MKNKISTIILILIGFAGLCLMLYPTVADYWNSKTSSKVINEYVESVRNISEEDYRSMWEAAQEYNKSLLERYDSFHLTEQQQAKYNKLLDVDGSGVMGYLQIDKIGVELPIFHGTDDVMLQKAIGHLEWSSLPIGGESTHSVVSGHRGLPSMRLLTDLDKIREGDTFTLNIMNEVLTYEVDQIRIVVPTDLQDLTIEKGQDYCTLVTCTPYGVNTHRLLVRGHRIENITGDIGIVSEAIFVDKLIVAGIIACIILILLLLRVIFKKPKNRSIQS